MATPLFIRGYMNLLPLFSVVTAAAITFNLLDWRKTAIDIKKFGLSEEKNPIMRFLMGRSKWLGLAYKLWPYPVLVYGGVFHAGGDVQNIGVSYANGPGNDYLGVVWIFLAAVAAGLGAY